MTNSKPKRPKRPKRTKNKKRKSKAMSQKRRAGSAPTNKTEFMRRDPAGHLPEEKVRELNKMGEVSQRVIPTGEESSRTLFKTLNKRKGTDEAKDKNKTERIKEENPGSIPDELRKRYLMRVKLRYESVVGSLYDSDEMPNREEVERDIHLIEREVLRRSTGETDYIKNMKEKIDNIKSMLTREKEYEKNIDDRLKEAKEAKEQRKQARSTAFGEDEDLVESEPEPEPESRQTPAYTRVGTGPGILRHRQGERKGRKKSVILGRPEEPRYMRRARGENIVSGEHEIPDKVKVCPCSKDFPKCAGSEMWKGWCYKDGEDGKPVYHTGDSKGCGSGWRAKACTRDYAGAKYHVMNDEARKDSWD